MSNPNNTPFFVINLTHVTIFLTSQSFIYHRSARKETAARVRRSELCTAVLFYFDVYEILFHFLFMCHVAPKRPSKIKQECIRSLGDRDSPVGIATRNGLDGPGIESRWGRDFPHPSRPGLGPTQPPVQRVPRLFRG